jgi:type I restriction enzyme, S subunit
MEKRNVPKLRFKGFEDEWKEYKFGDITKKTGAKNKENKAYDVYSISNKHGFIPQNKQFEGSRLEGLAKSDYKIVNKGEFAYNPARINVGSIGLLEEDKIVIVSSLYVCFKMLNDIYPKFFVNYFDTYKFNKDVLRNVEGGVRDYLFYENFSNIKAIIPSFKEQTKIANFLSNVDNIIEEQEGKVKDLEQYKKGMMQKIFKQEVRFKDENGGEYPEWEEKKLGECIVCLDNMRKPLNSTERQEMKGNIPYYGANGIVDYINDFIFDERLILLAEDGGNFDEFATRPIAQIIAGKSWINNHAHVLKAKDNYIDYIFYTLVHKDIRQYINGTSRAKLNKSDMLDIKIDIPCIEEQTKIANFLSNVDNIIEEEKKKLEDLRLWKKGLLQQMFV